MAETTLTIRLGKTVTIKGYVTQGGRAKDLTNDTITLTVSDKKSDNTYSPLVSKTTGSGISQNSSGFYTVTMGPFTAATFSPGKYHFDVELLDGDSSAQVLLVSGDFTVLGSGN